MKRVILTNRSIEGHEGVGGVGGVVGRGTATATPDVDDDGDDDHHHHHRPDHHHHDPQRLVPEEAEKSRSKREKVKS